MISKTIVNKDELFDQFSKNLDLFLEYAKPGAKEKLTGKYVCPICLRYFDREALYLREGNYLTREDVPPRSVGWKRVILTCKECNNVQGSLLDSHLPKILKSKAFHEGILGTTLNSRFIVNGDFKVHGTMSVGNSGLRINFDPKRSNPKDFKKASKAVLKKGSTLHVNYGEGEVKRGMISLLRAAYLWTFYELGYPFVFNDNYEIIRRQILEPHKDLYWKQIVINANLDFDPEGLNLVTEPSDSEVYLVFLRLAANGLNDLVGVMIPGAHEGAFNLVQNFRKKARQKSKLVMWNLNDLKLLNNDPEFLFPMMYWEEKYNKLDSEDESSGNINVSITDSNSTSEEE